MAMNRLTFYNGNWTVIDQTTGERKRRFDLKDVIEEVFYEIEKRSSNRTLIPAMLGIDYYNERLKQYPANYYDFDSMKEQLIDYLLKYTTITYSGHINDNNRFTLEMVTNANYKTLENYAKQMEIKLVIRLFPQWQTTDDNGILIYRINKDGIWDLLDDDVNLDIWDKDI